MDTFSLLFHLASISDPDFLGGDDQTALITIEANRLHWAHLPDFDDKIAFAAGYVMGREGMLRDPRSTSHAYDVGFEYGSSVQSGRSRPYWDRPQVSS
jgi:hypothetical protein